MGITHCPIPPENQNLVDRANVGCIEFAEDIGKRKRLTKILIP